MASLLLCPRVRAPRQNAATIDQWCYSPFLANFHIWPSIVCSVPWHQSSIWFSRQHALWKALWSKESQTSSWISLLSRFQTQYVVRQSCNLEPALFPLMLTGSWTMSHKPGTDVYDCRFTNLVYADNTHLLRIVSARCCWLLVEF